MASAQLVLNDKLQNGTQAVLTNQTVTYMKFVKSISWDGSFVNPPANISGYGGVVHFTHLKGNQGSKAAVIYSITDAAVGPRAVVLGWSAPADFNPSTSPNRVFGIVGHTDIIDRMTWDEIQVLLDKAGSSIVIEDGVCMHATILNNPTSKMADLLVNFSMSP